MTKTCSYILPPLGVPETKSFPVQAPVIETAMVMHEGEMQVALLLSDGSAVVVSFDQALLLNKAWRDWVRFVAREPRDADHVYVASMQVPT